MPLSARVRSFLWVVLGFLLIAPSGQALAEDSPRSASPAPMQRRLLDKPRDWEKTEGAHRFVVMGDAGSGTLEQARVAEALVRLHGERPFSDLVLLGDNVYRNGELEHFEERLRAPYAPLLEAGVRIFAVLGNHDVRTGGGQAQVRYLGLGDRRYYRAELASGRVELLALDTNQFVLGDQAVAHLDPWKQRTAPAQLRWLTKILDEKARRDVVTLLVGHHPMHSSGDAARQREVRQVRDKVEPLLGKSRVAAYLAGHDHHYERTGPVAGITHLTSGGGGSHSRPERYDAKRNPGVRRQVFDNHFLLFEAREGGKLHYEARLPDGTVIDRGVLHARAGAHGRPRPPRRDTASSVGRSVPVPRPRTHPRAFRAPRR